MLKILNNVGKILVYPRPASIPHQPPNFLPQLPPRTYPSTNTQLGLQPPNPFPCGLVLLYLSLPFLLQPYHINAPVLYIMAIKKSLPLVSKNRHRLAIWPKFNSGKRGNLSDPSNYKLPIIPFPCTGWLTGSVYVGNTLLNLLLTK